MAHGVPDDQADAAFRPRQHVEPVTADEVVLPGGEVAVGDAAPLERLVGGGQQASTDGQGRTAFAFVPACVVQGHAGSRGQRLHGLGVAGQEGRFVRAARAGDESDGGTAQMQRDDEEGSGPQEDVHACVAATGGAEPRGGMGVDRVEQLRLEGGDGTCVGRPARKDDDLADRQQPFPVLGRVRSDTQRQSAGLDLGRFRGTVRVLLQQPALQHVDRGRVAESGRQCVDDMASGQAQVEFGSDGVGRGGKGRLRARTCGGGFVVRVTMRFVPQGCAFPMGPDSGSAWPGRRPATHGRQLYDGASISLM